MVGHPTEWSEKVEDKSQIERSEVKCTPSSKQKVIPPLPACLRNLPRELEGPSLQQSKTE